MFTLATGTKSGSYSHTITFEPKGDAVIVRRFMRDELMGNWAGDHGQPVEMTREAARAEWRNLKSLGYK